MGKKTDEERKAKKEDKERKKTKVWKSDRYIYIGGKSNETWSRLSWLTVAEKYDTNRREIRPDISNEISHVSYFYSDNELTFLISLRK